MKRGKTETAGQGTTESTRTTMNLPTDSVIAGRFVAQREGVSFSSVIREALAMLLKQRFSSAPDQT